MGMSTHRDDNAMTWVSVSAYENTQCEMSGSTSCVREYTGMTMSECTGITR